MSIFWTPKPHSRGGRTLFKDFKLRTCWFLCALLLSSCGQSTPGGYQESGESTVTSGTLQALTVPPGAKDAPPAPGTTGAPKTADGLPALQAKSTNTTLFSKKISDEADRLDRLENAVQELRNDFDAMSPAIVRLVAIEGDIQNLIKQLEVLTGGESLAGNNIPPIEEAALDNPQAPLPITPEIPPPPSPMMDDERSYAPAPQTPAQEMAQPAPVTPAAQIPQQTAPIATTTPPAATPQPAAAGPVITGIRVGEHPGKMRIVLDTRGKTTFTADLDNGEKILVVELPQAGWSTDSTKTFTGNSVLNSYTTEKMDGNGTRLILQLKKSTSIVYKSTVNNEDGQGSRIIIDIGA